MSGHRELVLGRENIAAAAPGAAPGPYLLLLLLNIQWRWTPIQTQTQAMNQGTLPLVPPLSQQQGVQARPAKPGLCTGPGQHLAHLPGGAAVVTELRLGIPQLTMPSHGGGLFHWIPLQGAPCDAHALLLVSPRASLPG